MTTSLNDSALSRLPQEIASVQSHLQSLDEGVREATHKLTATKDDIQASQELQRALQAGIQTALQAIAVLELQKADLQALLAVKQQHAESVHIISEHLQDQTAKGRQQFQLASTSFAALCSKFQQRYNTDSMHKASSDCEQQVSQLQQQLLTAQQANREKQQKLDLLSLLANALKNSMDSLQVSRCDQESLLQLEQQQSTKLKQTMSQATPPAALSQATKLLQTLKTESRGIQSRVAAKQQELLNMQDANRLATQQNANMEHELKQLQAAVQALDGPAVENHCTFTSTVQQQHQQHIKTGVFGSNGAACAKSNSVASQDQSGQHMGSGSSRNHHFTATTMQAAHLTKHAAHAQGFRYPEDSSSPPDQRRAVAQGYHSPITAARQEAEQHLSAHAPNSQADWQAHQHRQQDVLNQAAAYTVQEPDSPCHFEAHPDQCRGFQPVAAVMRTRVPDNSHVDSGDLPAGCLYQDTTIRRTTTPLKNGKRTTAWAHEEFVTVRQIREIKQSAAHHVAWLAHGQPHVTQGALRYMRSVI